MAYRKSAVLVLFIIGASVALASVKAVGWVSFDNLIPSGLSAGVNVFDISNFTGDPALGGFALPPDFPVISSLTFLSSSLTLDDGISPLTISLGDLSPGPLNPTDPLQFPDTSTFLSATFIATLSQTTFLLSDGSSFTANSPTISLQLLPSSSPYLQAGIDFGIIYVDDSSPEPNTWLLFMIGLATLVVIRKKKITKR